MDPTMYALLDTTPFFALMDPGDIPVYLPFAIPAAIKTVDHLYKKQKILYVIREYFTHSVQDAQ
jgi:hypothetical protein